MKKLLLVLALFSSNLYAEIEYQAAPATKDAPELKDRFKNLKFEDYKVPLYQGKIAEKVNEDEDTLYLWRGNLEEALKEVQQDRKNINFAGKYVLVSTGCGTMCAVYGLLNVETGKLEAMPEPNAYFIDKNGKNSENMEEDVVGGDLVYFPDSRLIFMDGYLMDGCGESPKSCSSGSFAYEFKDGEFKLLEHSPVIKWKPQEEEQ